MLLVSASEVLFSPQTLTLSSISLFTAGCLAYLFSISTAHGECCRVSVLSLADSTQIALSIPSSWPSPRAHLPCHA